MKRAALILSTALALVSVPAAAQQQVTGRYAIRGGTVHTLAGSTIENGVVLISGGMIEAVGADVTVPSGYEVVDASGLDVYPGLFDGMTRLGLTEVGAVDVTEDMNELGEQNPHLQAATAVHPASEYFPVTRETGITHALAGPTGEGGGMAGQASAIHLDGWTIEEMLIEPSVGIALEWPNLQTRSFNFQRFEVEERAYREAQREYNEAIEELEKWVESARHYADARAAGDQERDLKLEAVARVANREQPFLLEANTERAINDALDFARRANVHVVIMGGAESWKVRERLAETNTPVILGPSQDMPSGPDESYDEAYSKAARLYESGVKFGFATFNASDSRTLPFEAAHAVPYGLPHDEAVRAVTINPAEILGLGDRIGTIEVGKIANVIVVDGDPLAIRSRVVHLFIHGLESSTRNMHRELYEKYRARPTR